mmetsp:Transcript_21848/g.25044  ORF Transcript_21848/g.25044 Transcript_21848/m.25044 type:complete len:90 (-) Transcript_21848:83-352(-)
MVMRTVGLVLFLVGSMTISRRRRRVIVRNTILAPSKEFGRGINDHANEWRPYRIIQFQQTKISGLGSKDLSVGFDGGSFPTWYQDYREL